MTKFSTTSPISLLDLGHLAITAFEQNSMTAAWCGEVKPVSLPAGLDQVWYADPKFWESDFQITVKFDGPDDPEGSRRSGAIIDSAAVQAGFDVMAGDYPTHFADFLSGEYDAETADVWWQLVVLGDIIYG